LDVAASCVNRVKIIGRFPYFFHVIYTHKTEAPLESCTAVSATLFVAKIVFSRGSGYSADAENLLRKVGVAAGRGPSVLWC
jgi:hypothetical protein